MKNIKIAVAALTVIVLVGGALAFKAKTFQPASVYCQAAGTTLGPCSSIQTTFDVTPNGVLDPCPLGTVAHVTGGPNCVTVAFGSKFTDQL